MKKKIHTHTEFIYRADSTSFRYTQFNTFIISVLLGDEILVVNGKALQGMRHDEAINVFKSIKTGDVIIMIGRRVPKVRKSAESDILTIKEH